MLLIRGPYFSYQLCTLGFIKAGKSMGDHNTPRWAKGTVQLRGQEIWCGMKTAQLHGWPWGGKLSNFFLIIEIQFTYVVII